MNLLEDFKETDLGALVKAAAAQYDLSAELVASIILQESDADPWLNRYEEPFFLRYVKNTTRGTLIGHVPKTVPNLATEKQNRSTSWGLMQLMGQTARELGYASDAMTRLLIPSVNLHYGCSYLVKCFNGRTLEKALLKWNGGGNPNYDNEVLGRLDAKQYVKILGKVII